jgi:hypothetical protein
MAKLGAWRKAIEDHYRTAWGDFAPCLFSAGPVSELPVDFGVLCFSPRDNRQMWTYATCGMSQPEDAAPLELHLMSPRQEGGLVELLYATAHYHRTGSPLALGHSVNFGRPWLNASRCGHGLISLPYLDGPSLEILPIGSRIVRCFWLIPITAAEVAFKKSSSVEALEQQFERANFNYLNPERDSVV